MVIHFIKRFLFNILKNITYIIFSIIYFFISWKIFGGHSDAFYLILSIYVASIFVAITPIGEILLRQSENCRILATQEEKEYLQPIFDEVYEQAQNLYPTLNKKIKLYLTDAMYVNAFAIGRCSVVLTKGAVATFTEDELKGVLAHELGHIANGDPFIKLIFLVGNGVFTVTLALLKAVVTILQVIGAVFTNNIIVVIIPIASFCFDIIILAFSFITQIVIAINSRINEYAADKFAFNLNYTEELISALYILQKISLPDNLSLSEKLKASHPNIALRIQKLETLLEN